MTDPPPPLPPQVSNALKMELPYPLALQIVGKKTANEILDIRDDLNVQFRSTVVHCFSIPQLLVHKKQ